MPNTLRIKRGQSASLPNGTVAEPLFTIDTYDLYIGKGDGTNQRFQKYIASGTTSQILRGDGSLYTFPLAISSPSNGQVLKYNGTNWVNSTDTDTGITSLNGLTALSQTFATGSSGTDFNIVSATSTHTFNIPTASGTNRGLLSSSDWTTFNNKQNALTNPVTGTGTTNYLPKFTGTSTIGDSILQEGTNAIGLGVTPSAWAGGFNAIQIAQANFRGSSSVLGLSHNSFFNGTSNIYQTSTFASDYYQLSGEHVWRTAPSGTAGGTITFTQAMTLDASGNLAVGNTTALLTSSGRGNITINGSSQSILTLGIAGGYSAYLYSDATKVELSTNSQPLVFVSNGSERMRITTAGRILLGTTTDNGTDRLQVSGSANITGNLTVDTNTLFVDATNNRVGIGTTSPTSKLTVVGGAGDGIVYSDGTVTNYFGTAGGGLSEIGTLTNTAISILTNGTGKIRITAAGNVGIGTTSPVAIGNYRTLTIRGGSTTNGGLIQLENSDASVRAYWFSTDTASTLKTVTNHQLILGANNTDYLYLNSSGNLGLGVTPSAWDTTTTSRGMQFGRGGSIFYSTAQAESSLGGNYYQSAGSVYNYLTTSFALRYSLNDFDGTHRWYNAPSGTAGNAITFTQAMTLNASGRLLLGTTTDDGANRLQVNGGGSFTTFLRAKNASQSVGLILDRGSATLSNAVTWLTSGTSDWFLGSSPLGTSTSDLSLYSYGTSSVVLNIARSTGAATFSSSVTAGAFLTNGASGTAGQEAIRINNDNGYIGFFNGANNVRSGYLQGNTTDVTLTTSPSTPLIFGTNNTERMRITSAGRILMGTTTDNGTDRLQVSGNGYVSGSLGVGITPSYPLHVRLNTNSTTKSTLLSQEVYSSSTGYTDYFRFEVGANSSRGGRIVFGESGGGFSDSIIEFALNAINFAQSGVNPIIFTTNAIERMRVSGDGNLAIGLTGPTAFLHIAAGTTAKAQIRLDSSTAPTSPNNGDIWFDGTDIKMRIGGVTKTFTLT